LHFENKTLFQLLEAPQEQLVPNEVLQKQLNDVNAEIDAIRAKIKDIEERKAA